MRISSAMCVIVRVQKCRLFVHSSSDLMCPTRVSFPSLALSLALALALVLFPIGSPSPSVVSSMQLREADESDEDSDAFFSEEEEDTGEDGYIRLGERAHRQECLLSIERATQVILDEAVVFEQALNSRDISKMHTCLYDALTTDYANTHGYVRGYMLFFLHKKVRKHYSAKLVTKLSRSLLDLLLMIQEVFFFWSSHSAEDRCKAPTKETTVERIAAFEATWSMHLQTCLDLLKVWKVRERECVCVCVMWVWCVCVCVCGVVCASLN
jgi:hypothetical protein